MNILLTAFTPILSAWPFAFKNSATVLQFSSSNTNIQHCWSAPTINNFVNIFIFLVIFHKFMIVLAVVQFCVGGTYPLPPPGDFR